MSFINYSSIAAWYAERMPERYRVETRPIVINQQKNSDSNLYFSGYNDHVWPAFHVVVTNAYSRSCANDLIFSYLRWWFRFGNEISHPKSFRRIQIMLSIQRKIIALFALPTSNRSFPRGPKKIRLWFLTFYIMPDSISPARCSHPLYMGLTLDKIYVAIDLVEWKGYASSAVESANPGI